MWSIRIDDASAKEQFVASLPKFSEPNPVATDAENKRLFVADSGNGNVYLVNLSQKTTTVAAQVKGALWTAIVVDNVNHKLFVADAGTGTIYSFGIDRSSQRLSSPIVFARNPKLRSLSGLAVRSNRTLLLADEDSKVIFVISKEGKFLSGI